KLPRENELAERLGVSDAVLTNRTPVGTYRGPGMTEATFVRERMVDLVARRLELDPADVRRCSLIPPERMPFTFDRGPAPPIVYESGDFPAFFERLLAEAGYDELRRRGGVGLAAYMEVSGPGPLERATIDARADGTSAVKLGVSARGQGLETALAQIAAAERGVAIEQVEICDRDTDHSAE